MHRNRYLLFTLPSFLIITGAMLFPVGYAIYNSFFSYKLGGEPVFLGFENYINLLSSSEFREAVVFSFLFTVIVVFLEFTLGLGIAVLLDNITHFRKPISVMVYLPYFITAAAAGIIFRWMYMSGWGIIDQLLTQVGINSPSWFDNPTWAIIGVIIAEIWQNTPFAAIIFYAGLQGIPEEQIEAAKIDGANAINVFKNVKLPNMRHLVLLVITIRLMDAFRLFDRINVLTAGGPGNSTQTLAIYNYRIAFKMIRIGEGSAIGVLTLIALCIPIFLLNWAMQSKEID